MTDRELAKPSMHFKPADGHAGDVIPFYWDGSYHAFYLKRQEAKDLI